MEEKKWRGTSTPIQWTNEEDETAYKEAVLSLLDEQEPPSAEGTDSTLSDQEMKDFVAKVDRLKSVEIVPEKESMMTRAEKRQFYRDQKSYRRSKLQPTKKKRRKK